MKPFGARAFTLILFLSLAAITRLHAQLQPNDHVAICGDSITEQKQYSVFIETYLLACQPQPGLRAMQFGWGGETSWGFLPRVEDDVLRFKPTVATTCYGMNDGGYAPLAQERAAKYREAMNAIVRKLKGGGVRFIVVGSPGAVDSDAYRKDPQQAAMYNQTLAQVRDIAKEVAQTNGVAFADVHAAMMDAMAKAKAKYGRDYHVGGADGVHPWANGQLVMAYAFLKALGCDGDIGTITIDMSTGKSEATPGHQVIESSAGIVEVASQRYPFCFTGDPKSPDATSGIIEFIPFNDELNRFQLIVKNARAERMKVTWGDRSKQFTRSQLERGVNLASEFVQDNPFSDAFESVTKAVRDQQTFETQMIKQLFPAARVFRELAPAEADAMTRAMEAAMKRDANLQQSARASVKPVRHRIVIEAVP
jgi:lysophospholipase L1-like esterase